jgi:outer membrane immunogenic protein
MGWPTMSGDSSAASAISAAPPTRRRNSSCRGRGLRAAFATLALILTAPAAAVAADMPEFLRGSYAPSYNRWDGFYFGAQAGKTFGSADFGNADNSLVSTMLANTELQDIVTNFTTLPKGSTGSQSYGGFVGYNYQTGDVLLGAELNYNHMAIGIGAQDSTDPVLITSKNPPPGFTLVYNVSVTSGASVAIHDIVTARTRAGWTFDRFLPYGFAGVAVGRADVSRFATMGNSTETFTTTGTPPVQSPPQCLCLPRDPQSQSQSGVVAFGFTAGLGVEMALMQNLFVRAEWEFIEFPNISDIRVSANSARLGVGLKF